MVGVVSGVVHDVLDFAEYGSVMIGEGVGSGLIFYVFVVFLPCPCVFGIAVVHFELFEDRLNCLLL